MGKSSISMAMFNSYVCLPEGNYKTQIQACQEKLRVDQPLIFQGERITWISWTARKPNRQLDLNNRFGKHSWALATHQPANLQEFEGLIIYDHLPSLVCTAHCARKLPARHLPSIPLAWPCGSVLLGWNPSQTKTIGWRLHGHHVCIVVPHLQLWPLDWNGKWMPKAVRQVRPAESSATEHSSHAQCSSEYPGPDLTVVQSGASLLSRPYSSKSAWYHHHHHHFMSKIQLQDEISSERKITRVANSRLWRRNVALSRMIFATSNSFAIASQKHCMIPTCWNRHVRHSFCQTRDAALLLVIPSTSNVPSLRRRTVWFQPAETWMYESPSNGGMLHCPLILRPHATALPSLRRSTEWVAPAETWVYDIPSVKSGIRLCSNIFAPQATT